jgi:hypothetical protein
VTEFELKNENSKASPGYFVKAVDFHQNMAKTCALSSQFPTHPFTQDEKVKYG